MIWFDQTKSAQAGHRSGLTRVSTRLREELGSAATGVAPTACSMVLAWRGLTDPAVRR